MTMAQPGMYEVHLQNTRALESAFDAVARDCRSAIARQDDARAIALTNTCIFLFGARMENRLFRLLYEPNAFTDIQRSRILAAGSIESMWTTVITEAFAARRNIRPSEVKSRLAFTDRARHDELVRLVKDELAPIITLRNVLGHGQWHYALDSGRSGIDQDRMKLLKRTRLWHLTIKANLLEHLVWLLHDLAVTNNAFERDFDKRWTDLASAKRRLDLDGYKQWERQLAASYQKRPAGRGRAMS